ncbi:8371_t:CDS:2 [Paraglomus brasilianum]|uniref:Cysteine proteinase 1, mitochondrial n=1 Tax=Paraglomus brasilianum TaxID=144538 RepID=A0A9N9BAC8_9GLOM|nr:8371_t:CDS:2 [Paraglomus brasilianum]
MGNSNSCFHIPSRSSRRKKRLQLSPTTTLTSLSEPTQPAKQLSETTGMRLNYYCDNEAVEKGVEKNETGRKLELPELDKYSYVLGSLVQSKSETFKADSTNNVVLNAIAENDITKVLLRRDIRIADLHTFSEKIEIEGKATDQKSSGRCWLFAATNVLRLYIMKKYNLDDFELSQSYLFFYDKLEKSNWFLENMISLVEEPIDSRLIQYLLSDPVSDGGQWDMVLNLVGKYGVVPKSVFPETYQSSNSSRLNSILKAKLREYAREIRELHKLGKNVAVMRKTKKKMMEEVYRIVAIALGEPPKMFDWCFRDISGKFCEYTNLTPERFFNEFVGYKASETFSLINDPRNPYNRLYTVAYLGNVSGGLPIRYVNIPSSKMQSIAISVLRSKKPVWFGADVGKFSNSCLGILDNDIYDYSLGFNISFNMNKGDRLQYAESSMTHAMVFTGVHLEDGKPIRWRVENSWGQDRGDEGYFVMSNDWFHEWVYQIVVEKGDVEKEVLDVLNQEPIVLTAWDPLGSLAIE